MTRPLLTFYMLLAACGATSRPVTVDETDQAAELARRFPDGSWSEEQIAGVPSIAFVLAAGRSSDPRFVAAALRQANVATDRRWRLYPEARPILLTYLGFADAEVRLQAIDAARHLMAEERVELNAAHAWTLAGHFEVKRLLCRIAVEDPLASARARALHSLSYLTDHADDPDVARALLAALSDREASVVSTALGHLLDEQYRLPQRRAFVEATTGLLGHADPGVRGRAAMVLAGVARAERVDAAAAAAIEPLLADPHPFVRAAAATALARLGATDARAKLMTLLDDPGEARYELGETVHVVGWGTRVDQVALEAVAFLSGVGTPKLALLRYKPIAAEVARAREWFAGTGD